MRAIDPEVELKEDLSKKFSNPKEKKLIGNKFLLKERFEVDFDTPIEWLDNNGAKAYRVNDRTDAKRELFALICNSETAPRSSYLASMKSIEHHSIMNLIEYGAIPLPPDNVQTLALVYNIPLGGRVIDSITDNNPFSKDYELFKYNIIKLLGAVESMRGYNMTHRSVRLDNLYYKDAAKTEIVLGDCISCFPAFHQPPAYETIENLMAQKEGRGNGNDKDDIYAVGTATLALYRGKEPIEGLDDKEALLDKLAKGSYMSLAEDSRIPNQFANIFRGLLNDNSDIRWDYIQAYNYLEGKPGTFQSIIHERPRKSIVISGEKVNETNDVIFAMQKSPEESYELVKSGKLLDWIKNGLANDAITKKIEKLIKQDSISPSRADVLIAKICIIINPRSPICIKQLSIFPDGAPKAIFYALKKGKGLSPFSTLFSSDLIKLWYQEQVDMRSPANASEFKMYINSKDIGYGIDRIIYDFDNDLPCLSPLLGKDFVNSVTKVLPSLDNNYANSALDAIPFDNNLIAYLRCKMGKKLDKIISLLNSPRDEQRAAAILQLYSGMQNKYGPSSLPNLGLWLSNYAKPIIRSYHSIKYQRFLEKEILKVNKEGKLFEILAVLEDINTRKHDITDYAKAKKDAATFIMEKNKIENNSRKSNEDARSSAMRFSCILAIMVMITSFVLNIVNWVMR